MSAADKRDHHLDAATRFAGHAEEQLAAGDIPAATALATLASAHAQIAAAMATHRQGAFAAAALAPAQRVIGPP